MVIAYPCIYKAAEADADDTICSIVVAAQDMTDLHFR